MINCESCRWSVKLDKSYRCGNPTDVPISQSAKQAKQDRWRTKLFNTTISFKVIADPIYATAVCLGYEGGS